MNFRSWIRIDPDRVAAQIAQELGLTPDQVQRLTRYSLD
ncbi:hypothetical protein SYN63AY4M2_11255 [Synechococcus sp. 63AY4M2]|nr:hypothetical protein SYN63AY4M2_11255 [Synechococcus sp. 63AY4M2]PIK89652.1 hypothetical protein SYN65AY6A5_01515 [Synechococcus sp. 65AY6A5]